jgi:predicted dehydrogenase
MRFNRAKTGLGLRFHKVVWVYDVCSERAERLAGEVKTARMARSAEEVLEQRDVDAVVVATTHDQLAPLSLAALNAGKHVLVEKPAARSVAELQPVLHKAAQTHLVVKVGFNHRFHPAIWRVKEWVDRGELQPLMLIRGRYGHGGRLGYEREWRADERISGGGETIDQGIHLIDLARWLLGDFEQVVGYAPTLFWDMAVEDNCFMMLRTASGACAFLHASWTEWKNMFSLEVYRQTLWVGPFLVDGVLGYAGDVSSQLRPLLETNRGLWEREKAYLYADSASSGIISKARWSGGSARC